MFAEFLPAICIERNVKKKDYSGKLLVWFTLNALPPQWCMTAPHLLTDRAKLPDRNTSRILNYCYCSSICTVPRVSDVFFLQYDGRIWYAHREYTGTIVFFLDVWFLWLIHICALSLELECSRKPFQGSHPNIVWKPIMVWGRLLLTILFFSLRLFSALRLLVRTRPKNIFPKQLLILTESSVDLMRQSKIAATTAARSGA